MLDEIAKSQTPAARYIAAWSQDRYYMWDELAACAWLDPTLITKEKRRLHGCRPEPRSQLRRHAHLDGKAQAATGVRLVHAQLDLDLPRFQKMFVELMTRRCDYSSESLAATRTKGRTLAAFLVFC